MYIRKLSAVALLFGLSLSLVTTATHASELRLGLLRLGDVDGNGEVEFEDAVAVERMIQGVIIKPPPPPPCLATADVNFDGRVDSIDTLMIMDLALRRADHPDSYALVVELVDGEGASHGADDCPPFVARSTMAFGAGEVNGWRWNEDLENVENDAVMESIGIKYTMILAGPNEGFLAARRGVGSVALSPIAVEYPITAGESGSVLAPVNLATESLYGSYNFVVSTALPVSGNEERISAGSVECGEVKGAFASNPIFDIDRIRVQNLQPEDSVYGTWNVIREEEFTFFAPSAVVETADGMKIFVAIESAVGREGVVAELNGTDLEALFLTTIPLGAEPRGRFVLRGIRDADYAFETP